MDAWDDYTEEVMDHYEHPRNVGVVDNPDGVGIVGNPACGDVMKLSIRVENDHIVEAKFKTFGCGAAIATSSLSISSSSPRTRACSRRRTSWPRIPAWSRCCRKWFRS